MEPWKERVVDFKRDVEERAASLQGFIDDGMEFPCLPADEQHRLRIQLSLMQSLVIVLSQRIASWL